MNQISSLSSNDESTFPLRKYMHKLQGIYNTLSEGKQVSRKLHDAIDYENIKTRHRVIQNKVLHSPLLDQ